jgi:hypothetical protein
VHSVGSCAVFEGKKERAESHGIWRAFLQTLPL